MELASVRPCPTQTSCKMTVLRTRRSMLTKNRLIDSGCLKTFGRFTPVLCLLAICLAAAGQGLTLAKPESVGLSSDRLQRIATVVQRDIDQKRIAGSVTLVARRGHVVWLKAQGMQDREASKPMQTDSIFRICSM